MDGSNETNPYIDSSVGALVWVRRRNGSWWPGRILGPEELPGSHLLSPRTGTPVKLLGREDGSVDWYNIEKSRRVKAFRCGEFDECIERARSLASVLSKKREKYARREDAILHALELEKKHAEQNQLQGRSLSLDRNYKELSDFADDDMALDDDVDGIPHQSDFHSDFMDPESSADVAQASLDSLFTLQGNKKFLDAEWEDDIAETIPRMRGLQDFGLRITPSKERKASWSAAYEHVSHASLTEDETKMASCITKSTATFLAPINTKSPAAVSKRKRSSQAGPIEDESAYKRRDRRRPLTRVLESSVKLGDGAVDLDSKVPVPPFVLTAGRNGYVLLQPKLEKKANMLDNPLHGPSELKSLTAGSGSEVWQASQIESRSRLDSPLVMDKACSSFSDHMKSNCCDGRPYLYASSQMDVAPLTGSAFVDSLLQGGPESRCSFFPGSAYAGSVISANDTGFEKASSLLMAENLSGLPRSFHMWPNYGHREVLSEKLVNEFGLRGQISRSKATCVPDYPFESVIPSNALPMYSLYNNRLEDNSIFGKRSTYDGEGSLLFSRSNANVDSMKVSIKSSRQCLSAVAEEEKRGGRLTEEDEADSFQPIPGSSLFPPEAVGVHDASGHLKQKPAIEGFPDFYDPCGLNEPKTAPVTRDCVGTAGNVNERLNVCGFFSRGGPPEECNDMALGQSVFKWKLKGRRRARARCRNLWGSTPVGALTNGFVDEFEEIQEEVQLASGDVKGIDRPMRVLRCTLEAADSSSEDEEKLLGDAFECMHLAYNANVDAEDSFDAGNIRSLDVSVVHNSFWVDVPLEVQAMATFQGEHVPLVSLMSKLNGKLIEGHPVLVERIEKRYGDGQSGVSRSFSTGNVAKKPPLQPVWRTARRTVMQRVPRSCRIVVSPDHSQEASGKQQQRGLFSHQNRVMKKSSSLIRCSSAERRKLLKRLGSFTQKTRMLSSIAVQHSDKSMEPATSKGSEPPLVTCIPVNVIFSRIREVLYRGTNHAASDSDNNS